MRCDTCIFCDNEADLPWRVAVEGSVWALHTPLHSLLGSRSAAAAPGKIQQLHHWLESNKAKQERYLTRQDNAIYTFFNKIFIWKEGRKEMFDLMTHSTHFNTVIWHHTYATATWATFLINRVLLYAPSHRQYRTYHNLCYTSRGALAGMRNSSMGPPWRINPTRSECSYHGATSHSIYMASIIW